MRTTLLHLLLVAVASASRVPKTQRAPSGELNPIDVESLRGRPGEGRRLVLNEAELRLQSLDLDGTVIDELDVTAEQAADLQSKLETAVAQRLAYQEDTSKVPTSVLQRRECAYWAGTCDETADCYPLNCDDCFPGIGVCFSYSR